MSRSKKFAVVALLAAVLLVGSIGGVAFAQTGNGDDGRPKARCGDLVERVCEIYEQNTGVVIDQEVLKDAFAQVRSEMRPEAPQNQPKMEPEAMMKDHLQNLVDEGKITQEQADAFQEWLEARPDVPFGFGFPGGHGRFHPAPGMGGPCAPAE